MTAKIINLADPDEREHSYATVDEAERALSAMVEKFKKQGYRVDEQRPPNEEYSQFAVYDFSDAWIGTYAIEL